VGKELSRELKGIEWRCG
jgi:hypothetical protein